jgi:hypothetical protein
MAVLNLTARRLPRVSRRPLRVHRRPLPRWARRTLGVLACTRHFLRGAWRLIVPTARWLYDGERRHSIRAMQRAAAEGKGPRADVFLSALDDRRRHELYGVLPFMLLSAAAVAGAVVLAVKLPAVAVAAAAGLVVWLGWLGRPQAVRETSGAAEVPALRHDALAGALAALGIAPLRRAIETGKDPVRFPDMGRTANGFEVVIDLPAGVLAQQVIDRREQLASALRRPLNTVFPVVVPGEAPSRLHLYVSDAPVVPVVRETILDHLLTVWAEDDDGALWCQVLAERLAAAYPETYRSWVAADVTKAVKPFGLSTTQVWRQDEDGEKRNRNGLIRRQVVEAAESAA